MSESCCACLNVMYDPIKYADGSMSERWTCKLCGNAFVRKGHMDSFIKMKEKIRRLENLETKKATCHLELAKQVVVLEAMVGAQNDELENIGDIFGCKPDMASSHIQLLHDQLDHCRTTLQKLWGLAPTGDEYNLLANRERWLIAQEKSDAEIIADLNHAVKAYNENNNPEDE